MIGSRLSRALALVVITLAACSKKPAGSAPASSFNPGPLPPELATGERLFIANCVRCHGDLALGTSQGPPLVHITYEPNHHSDEAFRRAAMAGVVPHHWNFGPMPPVPGVSEADVQQITAYIRWLQRSAGIY